MPRSFVGRYQVALIVLSVALAVVGLMGGVIVISQRESNKWDSQCQQSIDEFGLSRFKINRIAGCVGIDSQGQLFGFPE